MDLDENQPDGAAAEEQSPFAEPVALQRKYRQLTERYQTLVHKYEWLVQARIDSNRLSQWALRTNASGLCAFRNGAIILANPRFDELDAGPPHTWRSTEGGAAHRSLRAVIAAEAPALLADESIRSVRKRYRKSGGALWLDVQLERVESPGPRGPVVVAILHDVSAEVYSARALERAAAVMRDRERLRGLGEMAAGIAHDLNNTFNAMNLRLEIMERRRNGGAEDPDLATIRRIVGDAAARVASLQDFARRQRRQAPALVNLAALLAEAADIVRPQIERKRVKGAIRLVYKRNDLPPIRALAAELRGVFVNLVLNARDAMPEGGTIELAARAAGGRVVCTVTDQGLGIPAAVLGKIFDPFFTTKGEKGTGLGLSMARSVVAAAGGEIKAENLRGGGARFTLSFPVADGEPVEATAAAAATERGDGASRGHLLVVDDEADNREVMRQLLEVEGYRVDVASSGDAALARVRAGGIPDLVLCDVSMPGKDGWQVAQALKKLAPALPVIMLTGMGDGKTRGPREVLRKPIDPGALREALARALAHPAAP